jgi:hypothetical protein
MTDCIVVADNGEEKWAYGVFHKLNVAHQFAEALEKKHPGIKYEVAELFTKEDAIPGTLSRRLLEIAPGDENYMEWVDQIES